MSKLHVIFDLDDTLYPERAFAHSGFRAAGAHAERAWGVAGLAEHMIALLDEGHLGALFKMSLEKFVPGHTDEHLAELVHHYREHEPDIALFDDAAWALEHYAGEGPIGLITDGTHTVQARKVAALGIAPRFQSIVYTNALGGRAFHKPHPLAYETIEREIGEAGDRYVYIGDNPAKDFVTPNARGWISVQVLREKTIHDQHAVAEGGAPQHRITSLRQLPDVLAD